MSPLTWLGNPWTWLLLLAVWLGLGLTVEVIIGAMTRVEEWKERRRRP